MSRYSPEAERWLESIDRRRSAMYAFLLETYPPEEAMKLADELEPELAGIQPALPRRKVSATALIRKSMRACPLDHSTAQLKNPRALRDARGLVVTTKGKLGECPQCGATTFQWN